MLRRRPASSRASRTPGDLKRLDPEQLTLLAAEIRDFLVAKVSRTGGHLGPNLGVVETHPRPAPGLRLPARPDAVRHRPPGVRAQDGHRPAGRLRPAAPARRPLRLPEPGRERARPDRELARLHRPVLRRRPVQGVRAARRGPARGRRGRRRRAHRRHVLGGAQQHRRRRRTAWSSSSTTTAGRTRRRSAASPTTSSTLRLNPGYERVLDLVKDALGSTPMVGKPVYEVLHAVKKGIKDAVSPQPMFEDLGHQIRRPGRRPRRAGDGVGAAPGQGLQRAGHRARGDPQGLRLPPGRGRRGGLPARPGGAFDLETGKLLAARRR